MVETVSSQILFKISILKSFAIFTEKHQGWTLFLVKLHVSKPASLLKGETNKIFSCEYCEIFKNSLFYRTPLVAASGIETFFWFVIHANLKIYQDSMTQI